MPKTISKSRPLSHGRPPLSRPSSSKPTTLPSSRTTRTLIRAHHNLHKALATAQRANNTALAAQLTSQIDALGGLDAYQAASIAGQSRSRGGDSSRVLVEWLREGGMGPRKHGNNDNNRSANLRLLEVGALSTTNDITRSSIFSETIHIDLHAAAPGITQQDFMLRPLPTCSAERFDVLSLSLVLNYVPEARGRWDMLRRTCEFLRLAQEEGGGEGVGGGMLPALFLVLPAPCVDNSRYLDRGRLAGIMESLGYEMLREKTTAKLVYYLWRWRGGAAVAAGQEQKQKQKQKRQGGAWPKVEVNPGAVRNNFAIVDH